MDRWRQIEALFEQAVRQPPSDPRRLPFWAPDGGAVGFFATSKLKRIDNPSGVLTPSPIGAVTS